MPKRCWRSRPITGRATCVNWKTTCTANSCRRINYHSCVKRPVYVDYNATTPVAPAVQAAIRPWLEEHFGNASSAHGYGQRPREAVALARQEVAALIGARDKEIVFTGSATEADNLALCGFARALPEERHLVLSAVEHPAVMQAAMHLRQSGW